MISKTKEQIEIEERLAERKRMTDIGGGEFPPLRYSDEETERLLKQAYAAIPKRDGKRGTRNKKRQERRWWLARQITKKYKKNMRLYHERKLVAEKRRREAVKTVLAESLEVRDKDREYQLQVLQRWRATMYPEKVSVEEKKESMSSWRANKIDGKVPERSYDTVSHFKLY